MNKKNSYRYDIIDELKYQYGINNTFLSIIFICQ